MFFAEFDLFIIGGIFSSIWSGVKKFGSGLWNAATGSAGRAVRSSVSNLVGSGVQSLFGNSNTGSVAGPSGSPMQTSLPRLDAEAGKDYLSYMDEAYPGTNPWERLGSPGGASATGAQSAINTARVQERNERTRQKNQRALLKADMANKLKIARIGADAQVRSASVPYGMKAQQGLDYPTDVETRRRRLPAEISELQARAGKGFIETQILKKSSAWVHRLKSAEVELLEVKGKLADTDISLRLRQIAVETHRALVEKSHAQLQKSRAELSDLLAEGELKLMQYGNPWKSVVDILKAIYQFSGDNPVSATPKGKVKSAPDWYGNAYRMK